MKTIFSAKSNSKQHPLELAKQHFIRKSPAEFRRQFRITNWCAKWIYSEVPGDESTLLKEHSFQDFLSECSKL